LGVPCLTGTILNSVATLKAKRAVIMWGKSPGESAATGGKRKGAWCVYQGQTPIYMIESNRTVLFFHEIRLVLSDHTPAGWKVLENRSETQLNHELCHQCAEHKLLSLCHHTEGPKPMR
jgi:hypothetical protein